MDAKEIRGKEDREIRFDLNESEKELFHLRFRTMTEGNADPAKIGRLRRQIARLKTILRERELHVRGQEPR